MRVCDHRAKTNNRLAVEQYMPFIYNVVVVVDIVSIISIVSNESEISNNKFKKKRIKKYKKNILYIFKLTNPNKPIYIYISPPKKDEEKKKMKFIVSTKKLTNFFIYIITCSLAHAHVQL